MKLIIGLGNPGKEYENTRHNVGFIIVDNYCKDEVFSSKYNGLYLEKRILDEKVIFIKPQSYMNMSGDVVEKFVNYYKVNTNDVLIIRDDLDLKVGTAKVKFNSSSGGDNGVKSIISKLGTEEFTQFKVGISNENLFSAKEFVLGKFSKEDKEKLNKIIDISKEVIDSFILDGHEKTMNKYNGLLK